MSKARDAIISIRPAFAEAIISGSKTVELRRRIPTIEIGTRLWIYATRPTAAVIGSATVDDIIRGTPEQLWRKCARLAAIERAEFDAYFLGSANAVGLLLGAVQRRKPVGINALREWRVGFHPPQVIVGLTADEGKALKAMTSGFRQ